MTSLYNTYMRIFNRTNDVSQYADAIERLYKRGKLTETEYGYLKMKIDGSDSSEATANQ